MALNAVSANTPCGCQKREDIGSRSGVTDRRKVDRLKGHHRGSVQTKAITLAGSPQATQPRALRPAGAAPGSARRPVRPRRRLRPTLRPVEASPGASAARSRRRPSPSTIRGRPAAARSPRSTAGSTCWRWSARTGASRSRSTRSGARSRRSSSGPPAPPRLHGLRRPRLEGHDHRARAVGHLRDRRRPLVAKLKDKVVRAVGVPGARFPPRGAHTAGRPSRSSPRLVARVATRARPTSPSTSGS